MKKLLLLFMISLSGLVLAQEVDQFKFKTKINLEMVGEAITVAEEAQGYTEDLIIDLKNNSMSMGEDSCPILLSDVNDDNELLILCDTTKMGAGETTMTLSLNLNTAEGTFIKLGDNIENVLKTFIITDVL